MNNRYLFQSKNPARFIDWLSEFPITTILATTIETNRYLPEIMAHSPKPIDRMLALSDIDYMKTVTIEPIMDFDLDILIGMIAVISPAFVSIGADSKNHHLPEPSGDKIKALIEGLKPITQVIQKNNLKRLTQSPQERNG